MKMKYIIAIGPVGGQKEEGGKDAGRPGSLFGSLKSVQPGYRDSSFCHEAVDFLALGVKGIPDKALTVPKGPHLPFLTAIQDDHCLEAPQGGPSGIHAVRFRLFAKAWFKYSIAEAASMPGSMVLRAWALPA